MLYISRLLGVLMLAICLVACNSDDNEPGLSVTLVLKDKFGNPENTFVQGDPVTMELSITNNGTETETLKSGCSLIMDIIVSEVGGSEVWKLSHNLGCFAVITKLTLEPGETNTETFDWDQTMDMALDPVPPGEYTVTGWYNDHDDWATASLYIQ